MAFFKVNIKQQPDGRPGFAEEDNYEVQIDSSKITLFNKGEDDDSITFVRMMCGLTLIIATPYNTFVKNLQKALKADQTKVVR